MLPTLVDEQSIRPFKFHHNCCLYTGMMMHREFYKLVCSFSPDYRNHALALGVRLEQQGHAAIVTVSHTLYRVWVEVSADIPGECVSLGVGADLPKSNATQAQSLLMV